MIFCVQIIFSATEMHCLSVCLCTLKGGKYAHKKGGNVYGAALSLKCLKEAPCI